MRITYGVSLNTRNPLDAELSRRLEQSGNASAMIKAALRADPDKLATEQRANSLEAQLAWQLQSRSRAGAPGFDPAKLDAFEAMLNALELELSRLEANCVDSPIHD